jgi:phospholipid/cholesterol/gamma-HCH transport system permease protein
LSAAAPSAAWRRWGVFTFLGNLGSMATLSWRTLLTLFQRPFELGALVAQLDALGIGSISVTVLTAVFVGMVMALQFAVALSAYGASLYTGAMVADGLVRELGPVLTALLVGGRVASGISAELGSMAVSEQIDAIRALGADPIKKLVQPRVLACLIAIPLLTLIADIVGCLGSLLVVMTEVGVTPRFYWEQVVATVGINDLFHGLGKSVFFGYLIAIIGCWQGITTRGGTAGVGRATTDTVVWVSISILAADYLLSAVFLAL